MIADCRLIAFYLPQFHPIPENDAWWGKGFTEWRNVALARPLFPGHYQPHLPADLGFYDLRLADTRESQARMAREYGIHGFCYYHYWFNGKRLLEQPFNAVLHSGTPDLPFCLCWANENWTRRWDGMDNEILAHQEYSIEDDIAHIRSLVPAFKDARYIRVDGKPVFLVYRVNSLPDPQATAQAWRAEALAAGLPGIYLASVASLPKLHFDPRSIGFDASIDFQPDWGKLSYPKMTLRKRLRRRFIPDSPEFKHIVRDYEWFANWMMAQPDPDYAEIPCVMPGWDNSARRKIGANIFKSATPEVYGRWLKNAIVKAERRFKGAERIVFINAWNEWAEGAHLEPDLRWGRRYLEETRAAMAAVQRPLTPELVEIS